MRAAFILAAAVGLVAAQSTTSVATSGGAASGCGQQIDIIVQTCLATENAQLAACAPNDWDCLCEQTNNVLTCYNNCPTDPNAFGVQQTKLSYCNAAKAYGTTTSAAASKTASPTETASKTAITTTTTNTATHTPTPATGGAGFLQSLSPVQLTAVLFGIFVALF